MLSSENFVLMSQELRDEYDRLIAEGHDDDDIRSQLMVKFNVHLMNSGANPDASESIEPISCDIDGVMPPDAPPVGSGDDNAAENSATALAPTSKAKKVRKRRGTFENDEVVTSQAPITAIISLAEPPIAVE